jgi:D-alanyl-D-alanine carboxypeptidase
VKHSSVVKRMGSLIAVLAMNVAASPSAEPADDVIAAQASSLLGSVATDAGPGVAILVDRGGTIVFRNARGSAQVELGVRLEPSMVFRIASVTKMFTAALVLKLAEDGDLSLDDTLARTLPEFPGAQSITLRQLLSHTAGLSDKSLLGDGPSGVMGQEITLAALTARIATQPLRFAPGASQAYSNAGYILLGAVIEKATGRPWHEAMHERLFVPMELSHTQYGDAAALIADRVAGYTRGPDQQLANADFISMSLPASAGALVSNVDDLRTWMRALATGQVVSAASFAAMSTPASVASPTAANPYGFGLYVWTIRGEKVVGHTGQIDGFASFLAHIPSQDVTIAVLGNDDTFDAQTAGRRLAAIALGRPYINETMPLSVDLMHELAGAYDDAGGTITLTAKDGVLSYQRDGGRSLPLQRMRDGTLHFLPDDLSYFTPRRDARGRVTGLEFRARGEGPPKDLSRRP